MVKERALDMTGGASTMMGTGIQCIDDLHFMQGQAATKMALIADGLTSATSLESLASMCLRFDGGAVSMVCCSSRPYSTPRTTSLFTAVTVVSS